MSYRWETNGIIIDAEMAKAQIASYDGYLKTRSYAAIENANNLARKNGHLLDKCCFVVMTKLVDDFYIDLAISNEMTLIMSISTEMPRNYQSNRYLLVSYINKSRDIFTINGDYHETNDEKSSIILDIYSNIYRYGLKFRNNSHERIVMINEAVINQMVNIGVDVQHVHRCAGRFAATPIDYRHDLMRQVSLLVDGKNSEMVVCANTGDKAANALAKATTSARRQTNLLIGEEGLGALTETDEAVMAGMVGISIIAGVSFADSRDPLA